MALIDCPECNETISDGAVACPHCGYPIHAPDPAPAAVTPTKKSSGCMPVLLVVLAVGLVLLLLAIFAAPDSNDSAYAAISDGKNSLKQSLKDPDSVEFGDVWAAEMTTSKGETIKVACGYFNARNGFGGMAGQSRFLARAGMALTDETGGALMNSMWENTCVAHRIH